MAESFRWRKILFDLRPKTDRKDLFDREKELSLLEDVILHRDFASVVGLRRIGKTSLVRVSFNDLKDKIIPLSINLGRLESEKYYSAEDFNKLFIEGITDLIKTYTFAGKIARIIGNRLGKDERDVLETNWVKIGVNLRNFKSDDINEIIRELDRLSKDNKRVLVLFFDEFQNIKKVNVNYGSLLHDIFDWCDNTTVVVSGSIVGMMEEVLKQVEAEKPFYGRNFIRINLDKFEKAKSKEFLLKGFEEEGVKIDDETLEKALRYFDGIPGWLALFGRSYSYAVKHGYEVDLKLILREASKQEAKEFTRFLKVSSSPNRYAGIILALGSLRRARLKEIRDYVSNVLRDNVRESRVKELIDTLITYGFARKIRTGVYSLPEDLPSRLGLIHSARKWLKKGDLL